MKTYILSQLSKFKKVSSSLDEKTEVEKILCGKPWHIFNDGDVCETYLFEPNGKLRIILGGKVTNAQWEYVETLKCVQLSLKDQQYMLQLSFFDQTLLAMKLYSGNEYCIMIEESRYADSQLKTLNDVQQYFVAIAAKQEKQLQEQKQLEEKRIQKERHQAEFQRIKEEASSAWLNSNEYKDFRKKHKFGVWVRLSPLGGILVAFISIFAFSSGLLGTTFLVVKNKLFLGWLCIVLAIMAITFIILLVISDSSLDKSYHTTHQQFVEEYLRTFKYSLTSEEVDDIVKHCPDLT